MVWLDKLLRLRSVAYIVVIAFVGFAIWQLLFHVIFMVVLRVHSMLAQHLHLSHGGDCGGSYPDRDRGESGAAGQ